MTRPNRIDYGLTPLHVISRGVDEGVLFPDPDAHRLFWNEFGVRALEFGVVIGHVCLMTTHYHLLVRADPEALSESLRHTHRKLAWYLNRNGRRGYAMGRRYQVFPIEDAPHLRRAARYVPMNPVKARMVRDPGAWHWSTHRFLSGQATPPAWYDIKAALRMVGFFDSRNYERWVLADTPLEPPPMTKHELVDHRICVMAEFGKTPDVIAQELDVGERRVRRTLAAAALRDYKA
jgi:hypothetical protein